MKDYILNSNDELTLALKKYGCRGWKDAAEFIKNLPYGRNLNKSDMSLVLTEQKGSCSSKHGFLELISELNEIKNVKLMLCIFKMNKQNTPKIAEVLNVNNLEYIPEAHCFLKIDDINYDFISTNSDIEKIKNAILITQEIAVKDLDYFKNNFHREYLKNGSLKQILTAHLIKYGK